VRIPRSLRDLQVERESLLLDFSSQRLFHRLGLLFRQRCQPQLSREARLTRPDRSVFDSIVPEPAAASPTEDHFGRRSGLRRRIQRTESVPIASVLKRGFTPN